MREAEADISTALDSLQAIRRRAEHLMGQMGEEKERVRSLVREELWGAGGLGAGTKLSAPGDPSREARSREAPTREAPTREAPSRSSAPGPVADTAGKATRAGDSASEPRTLADRFRGAWMAAAGAVLVAVVLVAAWLVFQEVQGETDGITIAADAPSRPSAAAAADPAEGEDATAAEPEGEDAPSAFFEGLPDDPEVRAAVYDSLWAARSPLFDPLLQEVEGITDTRSVERSLAAWRSGRMTPLQEDYLHSALVQLVLRHEVDGDLDIDGTLLRNPCRGESCSALLNLWEIGGEDFGLSPVPDDAPRNRSALRATEALLVLREMSQAAAGSGAATPGG